MIVDTRWDGIDRRERLPALTLVETAQVMTIGGFPMTHQRVAQIERRALRKLATMADLSQLRADIMPPG